MRPSMFPPALCSSCFGQYPDRHHIDFESSWDGPVVNSDDNIKVSVDELIICEDCLRAAVTMLPPSGEQEAKDARLAELTARYEETLEFALRLQNGITALQDALDLKLQPVVEARPKRRPAKVA